MTAQIPTQNSSYKDGIHRKEHDWDKPNSLAESVVSVISELEDVDHDELPPLYESVDMEAVEEVMLTAQGEPRENTTVEFSYGDYNIRIHSQGLVIIEEK